MGSVYLRYLLFSVFIMLLQILVLNNIQFSGFVNPYMYVMIIILLPLESPQWATLIVSFLTGLLLDIISGTPGLHSSACLVSGFARPYILRYLAPRDGYEQNSEPSMAVYGFRWFTVYSVWMIVLHHLTFFLLEVFRFDDITGTLLRVALSSAFSLIFVLLAEYFRKLR